MSLICLLSLVFLTDAPPPARSLDISHIQAVYGPVQPVRLSADYFPPHDNLCYRFEVGGLQPKGGRIDAEVATRLLNAKGKMVAFKNLPCQGFPITGNRPVTQLAHLPLTDNLPPGKYTAEVTVIDNVSGAHGKFEQPVILKAPEFALVAAQFSYDPDGKLLAPAKVQAGQHLCCRVLVIGFDDSQGRVDVSNKTEIVEATSGAVITTNETTVKQAVAATPNATITFKGETPTLLQAGHYILRMTVTDNVAAKTLRREFSMEVTAP